MHVPGNCLSFGGPTEIDPGNLCNTDIALWLHREAILYQYGIQASILEMNTPTSL